MTYGSRLKPMKSGPVIVVFSFGAELDVVFRYVSIISVGKKRYFF